MTEVAVSGQFEVRTVMSLPDGIDTLAATASDEGVRNVTMLVAHWRSGAERFDGAGERLVMATAADGIVGVGGLTRCPDVAGALRVRRFYVAPGWRRRGVARALATEVLRDAVHSTVTCNARASAAAAPFWESLGFRPVDEPGITHRCEPSVSASW